MHTHKHSLSPGRSRNLGIWRKEQVPWDGCVRKGWKAMLGGLPSLPMYDTSRLLVGNQERKLGNRDDQSQGRSNKHAEANSCRTMGTVRGYFCLVSTINWTWWNRQCTLPSLTLLLLKMESFHAKRIISLSCLSVIKMPPCSFIFICLSQNELIRNIKIFHIQKWQVSVIAFPLLLFCCCLKGWGLES